MHVGTSGTDQRQIIGAFYAVYNDLGYGFLEKVYENALVYELRKRGLQVEQQQRIQVYYRRRDRR